MDQDLDQLEFSYLQKKWIAQKCITERVVALLELTQAERREGDITRELQRYVNAVYAWELAAWEEDKALMEYNAALKTALRHRLPWREVPTCISSSVMVSYPPHDC